MNTIKTIIGTLSAILIVNGSHAQTNLPSDTTSITQAQSQITRGHINNLLEAISKQTNNKNFRVTDYLNQTADFNRTIEEKLMVFQDRLEKEILTPAAHWMNQYNSLYNSKSFSDEQKKFLLNERYEKVISEFQALSKKYQMLLKEVYSLIPYYNLSFKRTVVPESLSFSTSNNDQSQFNVVYTLSENEIYSFPYRVNTIFRSTTQWGTNKFRIEITSLTGSYNSKVVNDFSETQKDSGLIFDTYSFNYYPTLEALPCCTPRNFERKWYQTDLGLQANLELYNKILYPYLKGSCQSSICVSLRVADISTLLTMIKSHIDRELAFRLADDRYVSIAGLNPNTETFSKFIETTNYPEPLPFEL